MPAYMLAFWIIAGPTQAATMNVVQGLTFMSLERCQQVGRHMKSVLEMSQPGDGTTVLFECRPPPTG